MQALRGAFARLTGMFHPEEVAMSDFHLRVVVFEDQGKWCAQCLEHDIFAEARTENDLFNELREVLAIHIELMSERGKRPFSILPPAPRRYFEMYENLERLHAVRDSQPLWFGSAQKPTSVIPRFAFAS
jgi:hypothetical protein